MKQRGKILLRRKLKGIQKYVFQFSLNGTPDIKLENAILSVHVFY